MRIFKLAGTAGLGAFAYVFLSACCDENIELRVFVGRLMERQCEQWKDLDNPSTDNVVFICPGEEVTICWDSNVSQVNISPTVGTRGNRGMEVLKIDTTTTITASPVGGCASSKSVNVTVISGPTPSSWTAKWNTRCSAIEFEIHEAFMSKQVKAIDITALFTPAVGDIACSASPLVDGFHVQEVFGFIINQPNVTESFSRLLTAVGQWRFVPKWTCPVSWECDRFGSFPFDLTLDCK